jgi:hypothetical protein
LSGNSPARQLVHRYTVLIDGIEKAGLEKKMFLVAAHGLYHEFDDFLVQVKSALDHVCTFLHFSLGMSFSSVTTFGNNGKEIKKKLLKQMARVEPKDRHPIQAIIKIIDERQDWLKDAIDLRDKMNHYKDGGLPPEKFLVIATKSGGDIELHRPMLPDGRLILSVIEDIKQKTFDFVECFAGMALSPKITQVEIEYRVHQDNPTEERWVFRMPGEPLWGAIAGVSWTPGQGGTPASAGPTPPSPAPVAAAPQ